MLRRKLLCITPHLSTGGLPQYLYTKISKLHDSYDIYVVMWEDIAPLYNVQRKRIEELVTLYSWHQGASIRKKSTELTNLIYSINPDVIHLEEFPENFLPMEVCLFLYSRNRQYSIIETSHDSSFKPSQKRFLPDAFALVSYEQEERFRPFRIPITIVEYPVENYVRPNREEALQSLGLDPSYKHVLNVGLFTPGKNQGEVFEMARRMGSSKVLFHFIGNMAPNFQKYWEPLINSKPENCIIWGEREDVDKWYAACDVLFFPSRSELNPLVPKEALSWHMPVLMYNLSVYNNSFSKYDNVEYLTGNPNIDGAKLRRMLGMSSIQHRIWLPKIKLVHLLTRPEDERERASVKSLSPLSKMGIEYIQHINEPETVYPEVPPITSHKEKKPGYYGAYKAFRRAIEEEFTKDLDFFMICECDCVLTVPPESFIDALNQVCDMMKRRDIQYFSFGATGEGNVVWSSELERVSDFSYITNKIILAHCILFPQEAREFLLDRYKELSWDSPDIWLNEAFMNKRNIAILDKPLAVQYEGMSLIDNEIKGEVQSFDIEPKTMEEKLFEIYEHTEIDPSPPIKSHETYNFNFVNGVLFEVNSMDSDDMYQLDIIDNSNGDIVYGSKVHSNQYVKCYREWYTPWLLRSTKDGKVIYEHHMVVNGKRVYVENTSDSLGDTIAWMPYVEVFRRTHGCEVYFSTNWINLFRKSYPNIHFVKPGTKVDDIYAMYRIWYSIPHSFNSNKANPVTVPLQQVACDTLGLNYKELRPSIDTVKSGPPIKEDYVCISIHSTAQCKYWNNPNGWKEIVDELKSNGYKVVNISREKDGYMGNYHPKGVIDHTGDYPIEQRINELQHCKLFIGVSSGLSWLAWSLNIPTVIVSGCTKPFNEPKDGVYRVFNPRVCNGCMNDALQQFDRSNWNWCPRDNNFICSSSITPEDVMKKVNIALNIEEQRYWNNESSWGNDGHEWSYGSTDDIWKRYLYPHISNYLYDNTLEIGCGRGRISEYLIPVSRRLYLVDMNPSCIEHCKTKYSIYSNIKYKLNDGKTLPIKNNSLDLIVSWDSFVHMHRNVIEDYVKQMQLKLRKGGHAIIHHSSLRDGSNLSFNNIGGRSNMDASTFKAICVKYGLNVMKQEHITLTEGITDCVTLLEKPYRSEPSKIIVLTCMHNAEKFIGRCIESIKNQSFESFTCYIVDDASTDKSLQEALIAIEGDSRFILLPNRKRQYTAYNYYNILHREDIRNDDIVVIVDGDDYLPDNNVFQRIEEAYSDSLTLITYGSFQQLINGEIQDGWARELPSFDNIRTSEWVTTHLRTFKTYLFRKILKKDLMNMDGKWLEHCTDVATMYPMLEMAGIYRSKYLPDINYIYNNDNNINIYKINKEKQVETDKYIRSKKPYSEI